MFLNSTPLYWKIIETGCSGIFFATRFICLIFLKSNSKDQSLLDSISMLYSPMVSLLPFVEIIINSSSCHDGRLSINLESIIANDFDEQIIISIIYDFKS